MTTQVGGILSKAHVSGVNLDSWLHSQSLSTYVEYIAGYAGMQLLTKCFHLLSYQFHQALQSISSQMPHLCIPLLSLRNSVMMAWIPLTLKTSRLSLPLTFMFTSMGDAV